MLKVDIREKTGKHSLWMIGLAAMALIWVMAGRKEPKTGNSVLGSMLGQIFAETVRDSLYDEFLNMASFEMEESSGPYLLRKQVTDILPLYGYARGGREILLAEGKEEENVAEENYISLYEMLDTENDEALTVMPGPEGGAVAEAAPFMPHTLQHQVDLTALEDYETLVSGFYTIDPNTMAGSDQLNAQRLAGKDLTIDKEQEGPQILIYHTHSQEGFADSVLGDESTTIMGVGENLAAILREKYGYQVLHHTGQYDVESRDDAYSEALPAIVKVLEENPSIQVVIDLHRDEMPEDTKLVMDLDGRPTARFMFFNGLSRTKKTGNISYLYNEYQEDNLAFSFQMQLAAESYYPGLARKIYLKGYRYNMHLRPRSLLIELGAQNNTVEEAMNACDPIAHLLDLVLSGEGM